MMEPLIEVLFTGLGALFPRRLGRSSRPHGPGSATGNWAAATLLAAVLPFMAVGLWLCWAGIRSVQGDDFLMVVGMVVIPFLFVVACLLVAWAAVCITTALALAAGDQAAWWMALVMAVAACPFAFMFWPLHQGVLPLTTTTMYRIPEFGPTGAGRDRWEPGGR